MEQQENTSSQTSQQGMKISHFLMPILSILLLMTLLPGISYDAAEIDQLAGGITGHMHASNILGRLGAYVSWFFLLLFGLSIYPLAALLCLSSCRRAFFQKHLGIANWTYFLSFPLLGLGISMLLGIWPHFCNNLCSYLNICTLPGGVLGQRLTSPTGCCTLFINDTGSAILSIILIAVAIVNIWCADWQELWKNFREERRKKQQDALDENPIPEPFQPAFAPVDNAPVVPQSQEPPIEAKTPAISTSTPATKNNTPKTRSTVIAPDGSAPYKYPGTDLLEVHNDSHIGANAKEIEFITDVLQQQFNDFGVDARVTSAVSGPQVTQYKVQPAAGVRLTKITSLESNLAMAVSATQLRIEAPIPGENCVGIEIPNKDRALVSVRSLMQDRAWTNAREQIPLLLGKNISGKTILLDLAKAPHLLIAGTTGSGKSVCMNLLVMSLLYRFSPDELRLIMVDPKQVEFSCYNTLPHLVIPVITDVTQVSLALNWTINEMERRYGLLKVAGVRDIASFNKRTLPAVPQVDDTGAPLPAKLPFLVVIIDELADIMLTARAEVENALSRIAAKSRAVGIHTVIATQRPDVKVITGTIKANFPVRIAFKVASMTDSMTILGGKGADALLGYGDMLFQPPGASGLQRLQCGMASDEERAKVVAFISAQAPQHFDETVLRSPDEALNDLPDDTGELKAPIGTSLNANASGAPSGDEALIRKAASIIIRDRRPTISYLQRQMGIGYNKAATLIEQLEKRGIVGPQIGNAPREILVTEQEESN